MRVTPYYFSLIDWSNPDDPIRKMAIPSLDELNLEVIFSAYKMKPAAFPDSTNNLQHSKDITMVKRFKSNARLHDSHNSTNQKSTFSGRKFNLRW